MLMDPIHRAEIERDISLMSDPEIELALGRSETGYSFHIVRRRGKRSEPDFRFRNPDKA